VDIGDIVGVEGFVFKTKMGEVSVHCRSVKLLAKSLRPLPEKFHGLRDTELKYRQRYVDLIMSPETRRTFEIRSAFIRHVRAYLDSRGFMEVRRPCSNHLRRAPPVRSSPHHNTLDIDCTCVSHGTAPKAAHRGGIERVYRWDAFSETRVRIHATTRRSHGSGTSPMRSTML
jgi:lysyl-tRNA synthetase class 2